MALEHFTARVYAALRAHHAMLPERLQYMAPRMAANDWLASYRHVDAVAIALDRMGERLKRGNALLGSAVELETNYAAFEADFRAFFPRGGEFVRESRGEG